MARWTPTTRLANTLSTGHEAIDRLPQIGVDFARHRFDRLGRLGSRFLALAVVGLVKPEIEHVRASYIAMDLTYGFVIIPLGFASLVTGVVSSLGTEWGLFRYYWVLVKLLITVPATVLMLIHTQPVEYIAGAAVATAFSNDELTGLRVQIVTYAGAALLVLLVATVLSTYKPRGRILYGARKLDQAAGRSIT